MLKVLFVVDGVPCGPYDSTEVALDNFKKLGFTITERSPCLFHLSWVVEGEEHEALGIISTYFGEPKSALEFLADMKGAHIL